MMDLDEHALLMKFFQYNNFKENFNEMTRTYKDNIRQHRRRQTRNRCEIITKENMRTEIWKQLYKPNIQT